MSNPRLAELTGKAGEHAVAAQIEVRGLNVYFPAVDSGVDLLVENGCRVQVKSAHLRLTPSILRIYPEGVYSFHFPRHRHLAVSKTEVRTTERRKLSETCDIVVLWGIDQNRFWVAPSSLFVDRQCIFMGPKNARAFDKDLAEMQAMADMGFPQTEIGKKFGITQASAGRRLQRAGTQVRENSASCSIRNCENAWEHIINFEPTASVDERENIEASVEAKD